MTAPRPVCDQVIRFTQLIFDKNRVGNDFSRKIFLHAIKWYVLLYALIFDNSGWEVMSQRKYLCIKYFRDMDRMAPNTCDKF